MIELKGHTGLVVRLAYAPDGRTLASASSDGTARLWDLTTGRLLTTFQSPADRAHGVAFAPDGKSLAVGYGGPHGLVQLWGLDPLQRRESWAAHSHTTRGLTFSPDGARLATVGNDKDIRLWDLQPGRVQLARKIGASPPHAVAISPDGQLVAAITTHPATLPVWRLDRGRPRQYYIQFDSLWGYSLAFAPDGRRLAAGLEAEVALWEPTAPEPPERWPAHAGAVLGVAFTPDGRTLLTGGADGLVKLWDASGRLRHTFDWQVGDVAAVAFAPDGLTAAAGGYETILIWDVSE